MMHAAGRRARVRALALVLAVLLAGCLLPIRTEHRVGVFNGTTAPIVVSVNAVDPESGEAVFSHTYEDVPPNDGEYAEGRFVNGKDYLFEAWGPVGNATANATLAMHSGSWSVTAAVSEGGIDLSVLHGD